MTSSQIPGVINPTAPPPSPPPQPRRPPVYGVRTQPPTVTPQQRATDAVNQIPRQPDNWRNPARPPGAVNTQPVGFGGGRSLNPRESWVPKPESWTPPRDRWQAPNRPDPRPPSGTRWSFPPVSRNGIPTPPRARAVNPRWPSWARIPPKARLPIVGGIIMGGADLLKPTPMDILFGVIPDQMERMAPGFWDFIGYDPYGQGSNGSATLGQSGRSYMVTTFDNHQPPSPYAPAETLRGPFPGPIGRGIVEVNAGGLTYYFIIAGGEQVSLGHLPISYPLDITIIGIRDYDDNSVLLSPSTGGQQPGTSSPFPFNGPIPTPSQLPINRPGQRPPTDPRRNRPDLQPVPRTSPPPATQPQAGTNQNQGNNQNPGTDCKFTTSSQAAILARIDNLERLQLQTFDALMSEIASLQNDQSAPTTPFAIPFVTEQNGERVLGSQIFNLAGLINITSIQSLLAQTVNWALSQDDKTDRIYQILGGDSTWGDDPEPTYEFNPDQDLRNQPVISQQGAGQAVVAGTLVAAMTGLLAAQYQRQGLQQFPKTVQAPGLDNQGFLTNPAVSNTFANAADVTVTTASNGMAAITGLNNVILKTKLTVQWLKLDRLLNLLNLAANLHNAAMLSRDLLETLIGTIENVLATFGLRDAEGNPFDLGGMVSGTFSTVVTTILGAETVEGINQTWNKANRILSAASSVVWSVRSIGDSVLNALSIGFGWVGKIGNALELAGVIHERFWNQVNPNPNFDNKFFTVIENAENVISNIDAVAGEVQSVTDTVTQIEESRQQIRAELEAGVGTPPPPHTPSTELATENKEQSQGAPFDFADLVPPAPLNPAP